MGRKAIFDVKTLKKGQKMVFPKSKEQYIYQYLNNFNRAAKSEGRPHRYKRMKDLEGTLYIRRIS